MGKVRVKIAGLNLPRLINRIVDKNIYIDDIVIKTRSVKFSLNESDLKKLDEICKVEHKYYIVLQKSNIKSLLHKLPYFIGALLAFIISFTYIYSFDKFVLNIDVSYKSELPYDLTKINNLLYDDGIVSGMLKSQVSTTDIQNKILLNINDISGCTVTLNGGRLDICVFPAVEQYEKDKTDIVSKYNAVVTKIETYVGEAAVKVGDIVQIGDVLIKNKEGAKGIIEGKVYFVSTIIYNENRQYTEKTGNSYRVRNINFCNLFKINGKNKCPFQSFVLEKSNTFITENYLLPVYVEEETYYEVEIKNKIIPFEEVESQITNSAYEDAIKKVPDKEKITNVTYSVVKEGSYTRVDCFIEAEITLI